jgi:Holliday junction resolvase-like predicted endonuclease
LVKSKWLLVKSRGREDFADPELAVGHAKQKWLRRLAEAF